MTFLLDIDVHYKEHFFYLSFDSFVQRVAKSQIFLPQIVFWIDFPVMNAEAASALFYLSLPLISFSLCSLICCVHCFQSILLKHSSCHRRLCRPCLIKIYLLSITCTLDTLIFSQTILIYGYLSFISLVIIYFSYNKWLLGMESYIG